MSAKRKTATRQVNRPTTVTKILAEKTPKKLLRKRAGTSGGTAIIEGLMATARPRILSDPDDGDVPKCLRDRRIAKSKERMLDALYKHLGVVLYAHVEAGISRVTHYKWMRIDPEYAAKVEEIKDGTHDFAEHKLLEAVNEKHPAVMIFFAKTQMRHRGYVERQELTGANGSEIMVGGTLSLAVAKNEIPPKAIEEIMQKIVGGNGRAEKALEVLKSGKANK